MKSKKYIVQNIVYDTDGEKLTLPASLVIEVPKDARLTEGYTLQDYLCDHITNMTGWCVYSFGYKLLKR